MCAVTDVSDVENVNVPVNMMPSMWRTLLPGLIMKNVLPVGNVLSNALSTVSTACLKSVFHQLSIKTKAYVLENTYAFSHIGVTVLFHQSFDVTVLFHRSFDVFVLIHEWAVI